MDGPQQEAQAAPRFRGKLQPAQAAVVQPLEPTPHQARGRRAQRLFPGPQGIARSCRLHDDGAGQLDSQMSGGGRIKLALCVDHDQGAALCL